MNRGHGRRKHHEKVRCTLFRLIHNKQRHSKMNNIKAWNAQHVQHTRQVVTASLDLTRGCFFNFDGLRTTFVLVHVCVNYEACDRHLHQFFRQFSSSLSSPLAASPAGKWVCRPQGKSCKRCQKYRSSIVRWAVVLEPQIRSPFGMVYGLWIQRVYQHTENLETFNISARTHPCGSLCMVLLWISLNKWTSIIKYTVI